MRPADQAAAALDGAIEARGGAGQVLARLQPANDSNAPPERPSEIKGPVPLQHQQTQPGQHAGRADAVNGCAVPLSDDALALAFVSEHGQNLRWTPGMEWMRREPNCWVRDAELRRFDLARQTCRAASAQVSVPKERRKLCSAQTVAAVLKLAQSDPRIVLPVGKWDADSFELNTPAGIVDLRTGDIRTRRATDFVTQATAIAPDFSAEAATFDRFMTEVFCGDVELVSFMQRALGYCLTGDRREQVLFFWHGSGANGKSTLLDVVRRLAGSYATNLPAEELMTSRHERHKTGIASLRGRRLAVSSELEEGQFWNEPLVKSLTGDETVSARFMRQDFFEFALTHKHVIVGNYKPRLRGGDPAMARRLILVPFEAHFEAGKRDKTMPARLWQEAPAILAWLVRGAVQWHASGLMPPERVRVASADYLAEHDDLEIWREECCLSQGEARASDLYACFSAWKQARGEHAPSQTAWSERLARVVGKPRKSNGRKLYQGLSLKPEFRTDALPAWGRVP